MMDITRLKGSVPGSVFFALPNIAEKYFINTPLRMAHFLAQCSHESGHFQQVRENLNYTSAGLRKTFKKYFPTDIMAKAYERKPVEIASRVYANRNGNGPEISHEGYIYRGRGYIQLTFKDNYQAFSNFIGEDCVNAPDLVAEKYPLESAVFFFVNRKIFPICDKGATNGTIEAVTKLVNGGTNGLEERIKNFQFFYSKLV